MPIAQEPQELSNLQELGPSDVLYEEVDAIEPHLNPTTDSQREFQVAIPPKDNEPCGSDTIVLRDNDAYGGNTISLQVNEAYESNTIVLRDNEAYDDHTIALEENGAYEDNEEYI